VIHDDVVVLLLFLFFLSLDVRGALAGEKRKWLPTLVALVSMGGSSPPNSQIDPFILPTHQSSDPVFF